MKTEIEIARRGRALAHDVLSLGEASLYTCPDCHGSMVRIEEGTIKRYRCHTGHAYSELALANEAPDAIKKTMWAALAQLEEHYILLQSLVKEGAAASDEETQHYAHRAREVREVIEKLCALLDAPVLQPEGQP